MLSLNRAMIRHAINYVTVIIMLLVTTVGAVVSVSPFAHFIADDKQQVSPVLLELAAVTGIDPVPQDLATFVQATQKEWLRGPIERWQILDTKFGALSERIMPLLEKLELLKVQTSAVPLKSDYLLLFGATIASMRVRLDFAKQLIEQKLLVPQRLVVLVGQRSLTQEEKDYGRDILRITRELKTETDAAQALLEDASLHTVFKHYPIDIVDTPGTYNDKGAFVRPTTDTTIVKWLQDFKPAADSTVVAVSTIPFVQYQDAGLRLLLPETFKVTTIGGMDDREQSMSLYLDSLARWIYQEHKRRQAL